MTQQAAAPAGWYPDPQVPDQIRYFDGSSWTQHVAQAQPQTQMAHGGGPGLSPYGGGPGLSPYGGMPSPNPDGAHPDQAMHRLLPTGRSGWAIFAIIVGSLATLATLVWILTSL